MTTSEISLMRACPRPLALLVIVLWMTGVQGADRAWAQGDRIPQEVIVETQAYSPEQLARITAYARQWCGVLTDAVTNKAITDAQISDARTRLLSPIRTPGATDYFKARYSAEVLKCFGDVMKADRLGVRLNVMIVVNRLTDKETLTLAQQGLNDASPSVRYWGAKSLQNLAEALNPNGEPVLDTRTRLALLTQLKQMGQQEASGEVLQEILQGIVAMDSNIAPVPKAVNEALDLLNARLRWHVDRPLEPFKAETAGLKSIYQKLLTTNQPQLVPELARVAWRFMSLSSEHMVDAKRQARQTNTAVDKTLSDDAASLCELSEFILQFAHSQMGSALPLPPSIRQSITFGDWERVNLTCNKEWADVLRAEPFNFTSKDLSIVSGE